MQQVIAVAMRLIQLFAVIARVLYTLLNERSVRL